MVVIDPDAQCRKPAQRMHPCFDIARRRNRISTADRRSVSSAQNKRPDFPAIDATVSVDPDHQHSHVVAAADFWATVTGRQWPWGRWSAMNRPITPNERRIGRRHLTTDAVGRIAFFCGRLTEPLAWPIVLVQQVRCRFDQFRTQTASSCHQLLLRGPCTVESDSETESDAPHCVRVGCVDRSDCRPFICNGIADNAGWFPTTFSKA